MNPTLTDIVADREDGLRIICARFRESETINQPDKKLYCFCCENFVPDLHKRSHIVPDWMFRDAYEDGHRILEVDTQNIRTKVKQTAPYGSYWCEACESRSSIDDTFACETLTLRSPESNVTKAIRRRDLGRGTLNRSARVELWTNIDFPRFRRFVFSVIIRAELDMRSKGSKLIAPSHFERIRVSYNSFTTIEDTQYPFFILKSEENDPLTHLSFAPYKLRFCNHNVVGFRGAGFAIYTVISSHQKTEAMMLARATSAGEMPIIVDHFQNSGHFKSAFPKLIETIEKYPKDR